MYVDFRNIGDRDWLNFQPGRFQIPFGEKYLRFGRGYQTDPFVALSAPPPWFWDEGVKFWGTGDEGKARLRVRRSPTARAASTTGRRLASSSR